MISTISGSNIICINVSQSQSQTATGGSGGSATVTLAGNIVVTATPTVTPTGTITPTITPTSTSQSQVQGITQLPKTGLPLAAWALTGLLPLGIGFKKFSSTKKTIDQSPTYIWQKRQFDQ